MVQTPPKLGKLFIELPDSLLLQVTQEQFEVLAIANRDLPGLILNLRRIWT
jgi:hypothetical protein